MLEGATYLNIKKYLKYFYQNWCSLWWEKSSS